VPKDRIIPYNEWEMIKKEAVLFCHFTKWAEENHESNLSRQPVTVLRFEPGTFQTGTVNQSAVTLGF
jgi:hypothetical protein